MCSVLMPRPHTRMQHQRIAEEIEQRKAELQLSDNDSEVRDIAHVIVNSEKDWITLIV